MTVSARVLAAAALTALLLAGCASTPRPQAERLPPDTARQPGGGAGQKDTVPPLGQKRGGGYYQDDGPGDNEPPPEVLAAIPDAEPKVEPLHRFANKPYSVFGQDYTPEQEIKPYKARGRASWYGRKFNGQKTASGEPYDMYAMTAAHPTLPIPSYARVTNLENGRSVIVRVNDRGPFHSSRIMDLSYAAAFKLGYAAKGTATVEVESLLPEDIQLASSKRPTDSAADDKNAAPPTQVAGGGDDPLLALVDQSGGTQTDMPEEAGARGIYLQLAAFSARANADAYLDHLRRELPWLDEPIRIRPGGDRYRLQVGPYPDDATAHRIAARIRESLNVVPMLIRP